MESGWVRTTDLVGHRSMSEASQVAAAEGCVVSARDATYAESRAR